MPNRANNLKLNDVEAARSVFQQRPPGLRRDEHIIGETGVGRRVLIGLELGVEAAWREHPRAKRRRRSPYVNLVFRRHIGWPRSGIAVHFIRPFHVLQTMALPENFDLIRAIRPPDRKDITLHRTW